MLTYRPAALLLLVASAASWAGTPINERRPLEADGRVEVKNLAGVIEVKAWDRKEVALSGSLGAQVEKLEISGDARRLSIEVRYPRRLRGNVEDTQLLLQVPAGAVLDLEAVSADIRVSGTRGAISAESVSGDVSLDVGSTSVEASTVSGNLKLRAPATRTTLSSVSGDLHASGGRGELRAETVSGDLEVSGGPFAQLALESVSGDLQLDVGLEDTAEVSAETLSGEIRLRLPATPDARVTMKTFSGELSLSPGPGLGEDRRSHEHTYGRGRGRVQLNSFSGDIAVEAGTAKR